jgi:hypothetical protein
MKFHEPSKPEKCSGKNCYKSQIEADTVAREREILNSQNELELKSYRCIICGQWHLSRAKSQNGI